MFADIAQVVRAFVSYAKGYWFESNCLYNFFENGGIPKLVKGWFAKPLGHFVAWVRAPLSPHFCNINI